MITVDNLQKKYGALTALKGLSFSIKPGETVGLLGPNGAGKTTLIKILTGYFEPSAGKVTVAGEDLVKNPEAVKPLLGYLPENAPLYPELTVQDNLIWAGELRGMAPGRLTDRLEKVIAATDLRGVADRPVSQLSKGFRQRVGLAQALLDEPRLLILDEPTNGLDPDQIAHILALIKGLAGKTTVLFSTHILPQVEECCNRALIIMGGELKADISLGSRQNDNIFTMLLADSADIESMRAVLAATSEINSYTLENQTDGQILLTARAPESCDLAALLYQMAVDHHWPLRQLYRSAPTLQDIFRKLSAGQEI